LIVMSPKFRINLKQFQTKNRRNVTPQTVLWSSVDTTLKTTDNTGETGCQAAITPVKPDNTVKSNGNAV